MEEWNPWATGITWLTVAVAATAWIQSERLTVRRAERRHKLGLPLSARQEAIVHGDVGSGIGLDRPGGELTKRDLILGERASRTTTGLIIATIIIMAVIGVVVTVVVPEGTTYLASLKYSNGLVPIPVWAAMTIAPLFPSMLLVPHRGSKKEENGHMGSGGRKVLAVLVPVMLIWPLYIQVFIGLACMERGGILPF